MGVTYKNFQAEKRSTAEQATDMRGAFTSKRGFGHTGLIAASKFEVMGYRVKCLALEGARGAAMKTTNLVVQTGISEASKTTVLARLQARGRVWVT